MRVLITGGAGNVGQAACRAFVREGFSVRVMCHRHRIRNPGPLEIVWGDVTRPESVRESLKGVDAVVHLAGIVQPMTERNPELARRVNVDSTRGLIEVIKEQNRKVPLVFASSAAVFGPCTDNRRLDSDTEPCNPASVYGCNKVETENLIRNAGIEFVILRLTSVPYIRIRISDFRTHTFNIPLKNRIEFCHPDDVALAMVNSIRYFGRVRGETLMIAGGPHQQMLFEDLLRRVLGVFGLPVPPARRFSQEPFPLHWYETGRSQELLRYQTKTIDDYVGDLAAQFPAPFVFLMRRLVGPLLGPLIMRLV